MRKVTIGNQEFTLLDDDEVECEHKWKDTFKQVRVNSNGEYVVGYGYMSVSARVKGGRRCIQCGKRKDDTIDDTTTKNDER